MRRSGDGGQVSTEHLGLVVLLAAILGVIFMAGIRGRADSAVEQAVCQIFRADGDCDRQSSEGGDGSTTGSGEETAAPHDEQSSDPDCPTGGRDRDTGRHGDRGERPGEDPRNRQPEYPASCSPAGESLPGQDLDGLTVGDSEPGTEGEIPGYPTPPPTDEGAGEYNSQSKGLDDRLAHQSLYRAADAAETIGAPNAARHLRHYLDASGRDLEVDPDNIMRDVPEFRDSVSAKLDDTDRQLRQQALAAFEANGEQPVTLPFETDWDSHYITKSQSQDWFFAMGGIAYSITGYIAVEPSDAPGSDPTMTMHYQVHVYDRYNWDKGKKVEIGPITIHDEAMGKLHVVGLAQEYDVRGSTQVHTRTVGDGGNEAPHPPGEGRDGSRSDPGRPRG